MNASPVRRAILYSLGLVVALRLLTSLTLWVAGLWMPVNMTPSDPSASASLQSLEEQSPFSRYFLAPWYRWDSVHYVNMAERGYSDSTLTHWPPLYPLVVRAAAAVITPTLLAALLVSTLATASAFALLYIMVQETWDEKTARSTLIYLSVFPTAFILMAAYTESLFLLFSLGCLYAYKKSKWAMAAALGAAAILTRLQGIVLVLPMGWVVLTDLLHRKQLSIGLFVRRVLPAGAIVLAFAGFAAFVHYGLGAGWPWETENTAWYQQIAWPWVGLIKNISSLTCCPVATPIPPITRVYDVVLACAAVVLLVLARKQIPPFFLVYAAGQLLVDLMKVNDQNIMISVGRFLLVAFPVMVAAALVLKNKIVKAAWIGISLGSQIMLLILFYWWVWVA